MTHDTTEWGTLTSLDEEWKGKNCQKKTEEGIILRGSDNVNQEFKAEQLTGFSSKIRKKARVSTLTTLTQHRTGSPSQSS